MKKIVGVLLIILVLVPNFSRATDQPSQGDRYVDYLLSIMDGNIYIDQGDFKQNPETYYFKALELGLANLYIPYDAKLDDDMVRDALNRANKIGLSQVKVTDAKSKEVNTPVIPENFSHIKMGYNFSADFFGSFEGRLTGIDDFTGFKVLLLTRNGKLLEEFTLEKDGNFNINSFDISLVTSFLGYKYEVYSPKGDLVKKNNLS